MIRRRSFPSLILLCLVWITLVLIQAPASLGADSARYTNCSATIQCGTVQNIGYPFWGVNRADYCGLSSEYQLTCVDNTSLQITISGLTYRVLRVDNSSRVFTAARADYNSTICPQYLYNSSQDMTPFSFSSDTVASNLTLYYGCAASTTAIKTSQFTCNVNSSELTGYFLTRSAQDIALNGITTVADITSYLGGCNMSVVVPANLSAIQTIETTPTTANVEAALKDGFGLQWAYDQGECQSCTLSGGRCGRNLDSSAFLCYCSDKSSSSTCGGGGRSISLLIGRVVVGIAVSVAITIYLYKKWTMFRKGRKSDRDMENFIMQHGSSAPKRFNYSQVKRMTNSFRGKLGQGGFGAVYKGKLPDGTLVAVKLLNASKGNGEEFINEVVRISRTSHVNIVALLGFCYEGDNRALIYEFMPNGSLDKFIVDEGALRSGTGLGWEKLYQIAVGIARGLEYLHKGCSTRILHFDIKPENILLDDKFCPKIADFGLSKLCLKRESVVSMMVARGTIGYIAPEVFSKNFGEVSHKSDIYSYGMVLLEMVRGRNKNLNAEADRSSEMYFHDQVYQLIEEGYDQGLYGQSTEEDKQTARKMALVGIWCIQADPNQRPSVRRVLEMLEGRADALPTPPKPCLFSPPIATIDSLSISVSL